MIHEDAVMVKKEHLHYYTTEEYREKLAKRLKLLRKNYPYKVTQKDIADFLHVERQHINRLENGKIDVNVKEVICYSKMFGCDMEYLLYGDDEEYRKYYSIYRHLYPETDYEDGTAYCPRPEI